MWKPQLIILCLDKYAFLFKICTNKQSCMLSVISHESACFTSYFERILRILNIRLTGAIR